MQPLFMKLLLKFCITSDCILLHLMQRCGILPPQAIWKGQEDQSIFSKKQMVGILPYRWEHQYHRNILFIFLQHC